MKAIQPTDYPIDRINPILTGLVCMICGALICMGVLIVYFALRS